MGRFRGSIAWSAGLGAFLLAIVAMYLLNPLGTASRDPRIRILGYTVYRMPSVSMEPTIPEGSIFAVSAWALAQRDPRVGEIIVFKWPPDPKIDYIKRVVSVGGSTVEMRHGVVYLDGKLLPEPYLPARPQTEIVIDGQRLPLSPENLYTDMPPMRVPAGHFFVLGDNRGNSLDSRSWGLVPRENVIGIH